MNDSYLSAPEPCFHGYRPLMTTAGDYGRFLAHVLRLDDQRWQPLWRIDDELAWSAGWGIELGPAVCGWQWGLNDDASNFVIGCPSTGNGVVILTDDPDGRSYCRSVVERELPGDHASLRVEHNPTWLAQTSDPEPQACSGDDAAGPVRGALELAEPLGVVGLHTAVLVEPPRPGRLGDPELAAHPLDVHAAGQQLLAFGELAVICSGVCRRRAICGSFPATATMTKAARTAQLLDHHEGLSPNPQGFRRRGSARLVIVVSTLAKCAGVVVGPADLAYARSRWVAAPTAAAALPPGYSVNGIDVYAGNGPIDLNTAYNAGIRFGWPKATEGPVRALTWSAKARIRATIARRLSSPIARSSGPDVFRSARAFRGPGSTPLAHR